MSTKFILPPYAHQEETTKFILTNESTFVTSDPGTGKTRSVIDAVAKRGGRALVFAPLSILQSSWGDDIETFQPEMTYAIAYASNRKKAFGFEADFTITNHDAVKWVDKNPQLLKNYDTLIIDESTAFKNKDSQRSKAMLRVSRQFRYRVLMTGTPIPNSVLDAWHQLMILDGGKRLGPRFYTFRGAVCTPQFNGFANEWVDKKNAADTLAAAIMDINIRHSLEDCLDMPEHVMRTMYIELPKPVMDQYKILSQESVIVADGKVVTAVHAGAKVKKLLQLCTGAVYDSDGKAIGIHEHRYDLVMDLVEQRKHSLVAFNWKHERDYLIAQAEKRKIAYGVIDGDTPVKKRTEIVKLFQTGQLQVIFAHPQSAGHGLTLTKGTTTIWCSPTYNGEHFTQFNRRIYRAGQKHRTETICIAAKNTWETQVYKALNEKITRSETLLTMLRDLTGGKK